MKRKTALQSAIDEFETLKSKSESIRDIVYLDGVIAVLTSKLPQEKQDLKKAKRKKTRFKANHTTISVLTK